MTDSCSCRFFFLSPGVRAAACFATSTPRPERRAWTWSRPCGSLASVCPGLKGHTGWDFSGARSRGWPLSGRTVFWRSREVSEMLQALCTCAFPPAPTALTRPRWRDCAEAECRWSSSECRPSIPGFWSEAGAAMTPHWRPGPATWCGRPDWSWAFSFSLGCLVTNPDIGARMCARLWRWRRMLCASTPAWSWAARVWPICMPAGSTSPGLWRRQ